MFIYCDGVESNYAFFGIRSICPHFQQFRPHVKIAPVQNCPTSHKFASTVKIVPNF